MRSDAPGRVRLTKIALSVAAGLMCLALILALPSARPSRRYRFESAAQTDLNAAREGYRATGSNEALYALMLALGRAASLDAGGEAARAELAELGRELYARAKAGTLDLETIGNTDDTSALLALLRELDVTPLS